MVQLSEQRPIGTTGLLSVDSCREGGAKRTKALLCLTSFFLNRNCRFRLERSMVSRSNRVILPKPVKTIFFTVVSNSSSWARRVAN